MHNTYPTNQATHVSKTRQKNFTNGFAARLRGLREKLGLSQEILGKLVGVSVTTIQNYESGQYPRGEVAVRLAQALSCSLDWLLCGRDNIGEAAPRKKESHALPNMQVLALTFSQDKNRFQAVPVALNIPTPSEYVGRNIFTALILDSENDSPFKQGQVLFCDQEQAPDPKDTVFIEKKDGSVLLRKWLGKTESGVLVAGCDEPEDGPDISASHEELLPCDLERLACVVQVKLKP